MKCGSSFPILLYQWYNKISNIQTWEYNKKISQNPWSSFSQGSSWSSKKEGLDQMSSGCKFPRTGRIFGMMRSWVKRAPWDGHRDSHGYLERPKLPGQCPPREIAFKSGRKNPLTSPWEVKLPTWAFWLGFDFFSFCARRSICPMEQRSRRTFYLRENSAKLERGALFFDTPIFFPLWANRRVLGNEFCGIF